MNADGSSLVEATNWYFLCSSGSEGESYRTLCANALVRLCQTVREAVLSIPLAERSELAASPLKPAPATAALPDVVGEQAAFHALAALSKQMECQIRVIIDPVSGSYHSIPGPDSGNRHVWASFDAVDGTIKLSGLNCKPGLLRAVNDGCWAIGVAVTDPTDAGIEDLVLSDFTVAAIVDGNPSTYPTYPSATVSIKDDNSTFQTWDYSSMLTQPPEEQQRQRLYTSTNVEMSQAFVHLDSFQAFDRRSQKPGDEAMAVGLYSRLMRRYNGGAFDVLRQYGNLSALIRGMLGWHGLPCSRAAPDKPKLAEKEKLVQKPNLAFKQLANPHCSTMEACANTMASGHMATASSTVPTAACDTASSQELWYEAQCGAFICINENLANMIPCVPIILGAGGLATTFDGRHLIGWKLTDGRTDVLYAANAEIHAAAMAIIDATRALSQCK